MSKEIVNTEVVPAAITGMLLMSVRTMFKDAQFDTTARLNELTDISRVSADAFLHVIKRIEALEGKVGGAPYLGEDRRSTNRRLRYCGRRSLSDSRGAHYPPGAEDKRKGVRDRRTHLDRRAKEGA